MLIVHAGDKGIPTDQLLPSGLSKKEGQLPSLTIIETKTRESGDKDIKARNPTHCSGNNTNYVYNQIETSLKDFANVYQTGPSIPSVISIPKAVHPEFDSTSASQSGCLILLRTESRDREV